MHLSVPSLREQYQNQFEPRPIYTNRAVSYGNMQEPRTSGGSSSRAKEWKSCDNYESGEDAVGPLPKSPKKANKAGKLDLEASTSSLLMDNIFSGEKSNNFDSPTRATNKYSATNKLNGSAISVMSLSVDNIGGSSMANDITDPNDLGPLFNSSLKLGRSINTNDSSSTRVFNPKTAPRRAGSHGDGEPTMLYDKGAASVLEMSVNTLGDDDEDTYLGFGESTVLPMSDSQANMSFANVFEETDDQRDPFRR
jgi:hypothetical protein